MEPIRKFCKALIVLWMTVPSVSLASGVLSLEEASDLFSRTSHIFDMKISPDGEHFFVSASQDGDETASIFDMRTNELVHVINFDRGWKIGGIQWISNSELAITPTITPILRNFDVVTGDLAVFSIDGKVKKIIYGPNAKGSQQTAMAGRIRSSGGALILNPMVDDQRKMLVQIYERYKTGVAEIHTRSGALRGLRFGPGRYCNFALDLRGQLRFCSAVDEITDHPTIYELVDDKWVAVYSGNSRERVRIVGPLRSADKYLAVKESASSVTGVYEYDSASKEFTELYADEIFDIAGVRVDPVFGAIGIDARDPKPNYLYLTGESTLSDAHERLTAAFPDKFVRITSATSNAAHMIAAVSSARSSGSFYLYDTEKGEIRYLAKRRPWLDEDSMMDMEPFSFTASDGLEVHGLFTPGVAGGEKGTVVMPHGGPHGPFDAYGWNSQVQFFSQMDINVVQVNFRGSGGFGRKFEEAGYREWSGKMIDDIVEGAEFIKKAEKLPEQMCVYGASYGAFAAASAVFRYPDYFKCAVGHVGVYDLPEMFVSGDIPKTESGKAFLRRVLGTDEQKLRADSPSFNVEKIRVPMLLTAGKSDDRAPPVQTEIMEKRMKEAGKAVVASYIAREGHGFGSSENEQVRLHQTGAFILNHLSR